MKYWAYKTQYCNEIVLAADIEADKVKRGLIGRWESPKYYSDGEPGHREIMFQRTNRGGNGGHFYYQSNDSTRLRVGAGETLSHALCKRAIKELTGTTLRVGKREIPIRILESSSEKEVIIGENRYRPDVSFRFESDSEYQLKWHGVLHLEVWHTHATEEAKSKNFFRAGFALFEMRVTDKLQFKVAEYCATKWEMERHVEWLKKLFSEWIGGRMLSDPKSREYLLIENKELFRSLDRVKTEKSSVEMELEKAQLDILELRKNLIAERQVNKAHQGEVKRLNDLIGENRQKLCETNAEKVKLAEVNVVVVKKLFIFRLATAVLALLIILLFIKFIFLS
ncbi:MAG: hypothetical protein Q4B13_09955 [Lautropia sp.]|nr:hypothetical protein [Lautropia sp.]